MLGISDINIPVNLCNRGDAGLKQALSSIQNLFYQLAQGSGTLFRFRLTAPLTAGSSAAATILQFDGSAFQSQGSGTVHDEEPGGFWEGEIGDEGWCTGRDSQTGHYSIITMVPEDTITNVIQQYLDGNPVQPTKVDVGQVGIPFRNDHATEDAPDAGWMEITGVATIGGIPHVTVTRPTGELRRLYLFNSTGAVVAANGGIGFGTVLTSSGYARYGSGALTGSSVGKSLGADPNSWLSNKNRPGVLVLDRVNSSVAVGVQQMLDTVIGFANDSCDVGDTVDVDVAGGLAGSELSYGMTVSGCYNDDQYILSGEKVEVYWANGLPFVRRVNPLEVYVHGYINGFSEDIDSSTTLPYALSFTPGSFRKKNADIDTGDTSTKFTVDAPGRYAASLSIQAYASTTAGNPDALVAITYEVVNPINALHPPIMAGTLSLPYIDSVNVLGAGPTYHASDEDIVTIDDPSTEYLQVKITAVSAPAGYSATLFHRRFRLVRISDDH